MRSIRERRVLALGFTGEDGASAAFVIEEREQQLKTDLPADRIWNDTPYPVLRFIICGGDFDSSTGHYRSNVIVYASLVQ